MLVDIYIWSLREPSLEYFSVVLLTWINFNQIRINSYTHDKMWGETTYPLPCLDYWITEFTGHGITYACWE